jgi:6-phosphogluconolactonase/glucosamine-6-phosphate isomerase/deaminase
MQIQKFSTSEILAQSVADYIYNVVKQKPDAMLVLTSGDTPKEPISFWLLRQRLQTFPTV